jgi:hypothetical protein
MPEVGRVLRAFPGVCRDGATRRSRRIGGLRSSEVPHFAALVRKAIV